MKKYQPFPVLITILLTVSLLGLAVFVGCSKDSPTDLGQESRLVGFDPAKEELFFAEKGTGAFMNETRLRVSARHRMIESIFATGLPFAGRADLPETIRDLARILPACAGVRRFGARPRPQRRGPDQRRGGAPG